MRQNPKLLFIITCILYFSACSKQPISNYRDALLGTYSGLQTGTNGTYSTGVSPTIYNYTDSVVTYKIISSITDENALIFGENVVYKELESTNYYLFSDSIRTENHATRFDEGSSTITLITKIEFFTDRDSISIHSERRGSYFGPGNVSYYRERKTTFSGLK